MPLNEIKRNIEDSAKKEAKSVRDSAEKERDSILEAAMEQVKEIRKAANDAISGELERLEREYKASAEFEERNIMLAARQAALEAELNSVRNALVKRIKSHPSYPKLFKNAIKSAIALYPDKEFTIVTAKSDTKLVDQKGVRVESGNVNGGLVIYSNDKSVRIDATVDKLVDSKMDEIRSMMLEHMPIPEAKMHQTEHKHIEKKSVKKPAKKAPQKKRKR
ncbi:MAG: hypothetical protein KGH60_02715 [Candidatus Micrarchaeota archaeon]|nr:hypothetical protein [Candidatus Micrarchaeota archaeon]